MPNESRKRTILAAAIVCLICSILVSTAAVVLKPRQETNKKLEKMTNVLKVSGLYKKEADLETIFKEKLEPQIIDLRSGETLPPEKYDKFLNPADYDIKKTAGHPGYGAAIAAGDIARIQRRPLFVLIYYVIENGKRTKVILPVFGKGLWSTMYGFLALDMDLKTAAGFTVYDHGETPGLGGEVSNPRWQALWQGKSIEFDAQNRLLLRVIKSKVDPADPDAKYKIDGLSGASLTTAGVDNMIRFWLQDSGYGPFLRKLKQLRKEQANE